ncbi:hypothetical protein SGPA1_30236 [Streptomyces misionensis JCM 4497]
MPRSTETEANAPSGTRSSPSSRRSDPTDSARPGVSRRASPSKTQVPSFWMISATEGLFHRICGRVVSTRYEGSACETEPQLDSPNRPRSRFAAARRGGRRLRPRRRPHRARGARRRRGRPRRGPHPAGPGGPGPRLRHPGRSAVPPHPGHRRPGRRLGRGPPRRRLSRRHPAALHRLSAAAHRPRRRHPPPPGQDRPGRRGVPAAQRPRRRHPHRGHPGRSLPRCADAASAAAGRRGEEDGEPAELVDRRRHHRGPAPLRLPRRHAGRLPALLRRRPGEAVHRRTRPVQGQRAASAPQRRPGLAHRRRLLAAPRVLRRRHRGRRRQGRLLHQGAVPADRLLRRLPLRGGRPGDRHARPHQRGPRLVCQAELRRRGTPALHRHQRRLQLAVRLQGRHLHLRRRRRAGAGRAHPGPLSAHRRRRGALHQPRRLRDVHGPGPADRRQVRQDGHRLAPAHRRPPRQGRPRPVLGPGRHQRGREGPGRAGRPQRHGADPVPGRPGLPGHEVHQGHQARPHLGGPGGGAQVVRLGPRRLSAGRAGVGGQGRGGAPVVGDAEDVRRHRVHGLPAAAGRGRAGLVAGGHPRLGHLQGAPGRPGPTLGRPRHPLLQVAAGALAHELRRR